ncbi:BIG1, ER integral membrane cell wall biogenesis [Cordyceps fumosorosea ARSEF 2679]|uniref:Protein BIG1 n=1 Tax=Cordyceps fumosorosea (strain ARSEF 2679) TaxID=1081104 RepID=A0A162KN51_CORFA|nr:BIG1, ER integral membrane cell wall biogenesis [Cordyceps fumosorosea ARSEF 2679]OAA66244.1 BIG1, ER integral membrane cell wall biogenesis [Cordyceps fumosorosea ARSEF 2679]
MHLQAFIGSLALSGVAVAFSDATPWILYSTASFPSTDSKQLQMSADVLQNTKEILSSCPTSHYVFATQPGMMSSDLQRNEGSDMPSLHRAVTLDDRIQGKYIVSEVVGDINAGNLVNFVKTACSQSGKAAIVEQVSLSQLPQEDRQDALLINDRALGERIGKENGHESFTVLFYATRPEPAYEAQFDEAVHQDLRRATQDIKNPEEKDNRPLFEKYQFFTPGVFMGLITAIVLSSILGVGIKALGSLEVSYGAFEKEMGPAAQKKQ